MKILFFLHSSGIKEGSSIAVISIIKQMQIRGHTIYAICPRQGELVDVLKQMGVKFFIIRYAPAIYPKVYTIKSFLSWPGRFLERLWYNHVAEIKITKWVQEISPDVIHTNVGVLRVGYYVAKKLHIPHIWHVRETEEGLSSHHYPSYRFQCRLLNNNDFNIAITENVKHYYHLNDKNTTVVYDGVFSSSFKTVKSEKKETYFLFVGRIIETKGADWAVEAFIKIADKYPDYELWLAGPDSTPFASTLKVKVDSTPFRQRIKFLGQRSDIYDLMSRAQAVLVPSVFEGFGFITVEAMLNRTLVIGRNTGGTKEQFDNGYKIIGYEIAFRCNSIDEMAAQMECVLKNGQQNFNNMIVSAEKVVRKLYSVENNAEQIMKIYNTLKNEDKSKGYCHVFATVSSYPRE